MTIRDLSYTIRHGDEYTRFPPGLCRLQGKGAQGRGRPRPGQGRGIPLHIGRISFTSPPATVLGHLLNYVTVLPITLEIALAAPALALSHGDQFDRIITATAKAHRLPLLTKDANIADASVVDTIW